MRRSLFGLMALLALASLAFMTGCERIQTLRVVTVNHGSLFDCDVRDHWLYVDPIEKDSSMEVAIFDDTVTVEMQYVEIGAGLPTWTPYQAILTKGTIKYTSLREETEYEDVVTPLTVSVPADPEGKKTTKFKMCVVPAWWKELYFSEGDPDEIIDVVDAEITFSAYDSISMMTRTAKGNLQIEIADFYDDPEGAGR